MKRFGKLILPSLAITIIATISSMPKAEAGSLFVGNYGGTSNTIDLKYVYPGDILYMGNESSQIGTWYHNVLATSYAYYDSSKGRYDANYIEANKYDTLDNDVVQGKGVVGWMREHDWAAAQNVVPYNIYSQKNDVPTIAARFSGPYVWYKGYFDNSGWHCSKVVSRAWYDTAQFNEYKTNVSPIQLGWKYPDDTYVDVNTSNFAFSIANGPHRYSGDAPKNVSKQDIPEPILERLEELKSRGVEVDISELQITSGTNKPGFEKIMKNKLKMNLITLDEAESITGLNQKQIMEMVGKDIFEKAKGNNGKPEWLFSKKD